MFWTPKGNTTIDLGTYDIHDIVSMLLSTCKRHMTRANSRTITQELGCQDSVYGGSKDP